MSEDAQVILETPTEAVIRDELHRLVLADLHGPLGGETEEFGNERPTDRYVVGRLAPDGTVIEPDTQDETADSNGADLGEDQPEPSAPNIVSIAPSALGCTSYVAGDTAELSVTRSGRGTGGPIRDRVGTGTGLAAGSGAWVGADHAGRWRTRPTAAQ